MSHPTTSTEFDKYGTFKITTSNTVKRTSNESHSHDDDSKKLRLEKSGSNSSVLSGGSSTSNNITLSSIGDASISKKLKPRKIVNDSNTIQQYQLIVDDSAGALSEESSSGGAGGSNETCIKTFSSSAGGEEMVLIRKQVPVKGSESSDVSVEERIIHIEGDPGGSTPGTSYLTAVSTKPAPKRLQIGMMDTKKNIGESIDLKLITTTGEGPTAGKFSMISTGEKKPEQQILIAASNTAVNSQNTFTYSRVCSVGSVTGQVGETVSLKSLQGTVKNQSLMVSSKKLLPEVTQTTAKVSIGNTTISVPLLKPLNSSQIIQAGGSASSQSGPTDGTKSVIHTIQATSNQSPQTQLSKILNIKRGQKVSQPTFVSLSQLQIKPVSSAKIVQAKVVSKKIPLHIQSVQTSKTSMLQQTSGIVTITSSKPELQGQQAQGTLQGHILPSPQKKHQISFVKDLPAGAVLKTTLSNSSEEFIATSTQAISSSLPPTDTGTTTMINTDKTQYNKNPVTANENSGPSIISTEFLPAGVKVVHTSSSSHINNANLRPITSQVDNVDQTNTQQSSQPQRINICPTISIVRQNSPQLVTSSGNMSSVSFSMADTSSGQQKLILTKSQFANVSSSSSSGGNTVTANFPRNISLMLAKNAAGQQVFTNAGGKATLCVTTSANSSMQKATGRMSFNINSNVLTTSSTPTSSGSVTTGQGNERDSSTTATEDSQQQVQQTTQHSQCNVLSNRKIIQVLPGNLYSSSGGSFVQITKAKVDSEEEKKKAGDIDHVPTQSQQTVHQQIQIQQLQQQPQQHQQQPQQQQIHLQIQQAPGIQQSSQQQHQQQQTQQQQQQTQQQQQQTQQQQQQQQQLQQHQQQQQQQPQQQQQHQQHQVQIQIQQQQHHQQQQQNQPQQHIQIQQIQTQIPQSQQQQQRHQALQQQRQQLIHKHQLQQQLQKQQQQQQHILQQQAASQNQDGITTTDSSQSQHSFVTSATTMSTTSNADQQTPPPQQQLQHHITAMSALPPKPEESNNVLLKQLLQNSNSTPVNSQSSGQISRRNSVHAPPSSALPSRKVINVRAPSLGLVSSLEAQLARPVIPPVPASESNAQTSSSSAQSHPQQSSSMTAATTTSSLSQSTKMTIDAVKVVSGQHIGFSSAPTTPQSSSVNPSTPTLSAPSLVISTSKSLSSVGGSEKPKLSSSPLISKETSFVSKPPLSEQSEQKIEIFSLQSTAGDATTKPELQQQQQQQKLERLGQTTPGHSQMINPAFKTYSNHSSTNQGNSSISTKITKYVQEVKKASEQQMQQQQQQQQQHLTITRTFNSGGFSGNSNLIGNSKEKNIGSVNINTHSASHPTTVANVTLHQQQQIMTGGMQQQSKLFGSAGDGNAQDSSSKTKLIESNVTPIQQSHHSASSNQIQMSHMAAHQHQQQQQQQAPKKVESPKVKIEPEELDNFQQNQLQQQQPNVSIRQLSSGPSPMSTPTPTNSVPSTPTTECQTPLNVINKQHTPVAAQTTTSAQSTGSKEGDQRKKRKREQPKQTKKQTVNTKETVASSTANSTSAASAANNKKRSRKSLKLEEDYDTFIENLMLHLRQMPPMQVLEPTLNVNYGVCNLYGWRNWTRQSSSSSNSPPKESRQSERANLFENELVGKYGAAYLPNKVPFYDMDTICDQKSNDSNSSPSMQNNYYDQEFKSFTYKTEAEKLTSWCKVYRERAVDTPEVVSNRLMVPIDPVKTMRLNMLQQETFPGLILMSSTQQKLGRMSPVIPIVNSMALITKRKKTPLKPLENETLTHGMHIKENPEDIDCKLGLKPNANSQNVILSLPTSSAERLLDVLKNLASLLQINEPIPYKVVEDSDTESEPRSTSMSDSDRELALKFLSIQDILNGRSKMCRQCGNAIKGRCIKTNSELYKTQYHARLNRPTQPTYFCNKNCYIQFRWSIEKKLPGASSLKSVLASKEGASNDDQLIEDILDVKPDIKELQEVSKADVTSQVKLVEPVAKTKKVCFRYFNSKCFQPATPVKRMSEKEIRDMLFKMDITMSATSSHESGNHSHAIDDRRSCVLCSQVGDGVADGPSRLLNYDVDKWVHLNCALWSTDVYETISGGLMNFQMALQMGLNQTCVSCQQLGATVKCYKTRCGAVFHLPCAIRDQCVFYQNKTIHCHPHASRNDKDKELLSLTVSRRVFVERDENRQVAAIMHHSEMVNLLRVGSLIFLNVGQLLPHQLEAFHTPNYIYPIGYKMIRFYWSMRHPNKRCRYICSIAEVAGRPEFRIIVQEPSEADVDLRDISPKAVWQRVLQPIAEMRKSHKLVKLYPEFISGEDLFGLTEPTIVRIIESLPGVETLTNYRFKYGRNPLLDLPLALNPSGAARTEPKLRQLMGWKKHHPQRTCSTVSTLGSGGAHQNAMSSVSAVGEVTCPYSKQFVHSKSSQYKKMKQEWRNNVYLARSKIQGLGLYAARDLEKHTMIIEYIGEVIRTEVSEIREKQYEARNRGIYMFRLDEDRVVDATLSGGLARYINHSCNPNCVTEIVEVDRELRIIIFAKRRINRGEELSYDYKFDIEDDGSKIPCMCGAPNCRKWMN